MTRLHMTLAVSTLTYPALSISTVVSFVYKGTTLAKLCARQSAVSGTLNTTTTTKNYRLVASYSYEQEFKLMTRTGMQVGN